jgi:predicted NUDIX family phosphoesterase
MKKHEPKAGAVFVKDRDEQILVLARSNIASLCFNGLESVDMDSYHKLIKAKGEFMWRSEAETDVNYKQIIPYIVFMHDNKLFLMQRKSSSSETRLANKYTLGIGGHIRKSDLKERDIALWGLREFKEEVNYDGEISIQPIGLINDESTFVGQVHMGFAFLFTGDSATISVKSELQSGKLVSFEECESYFESMESWSQMVFSYLKNQQ